MSAVDVGDEAALATIDSVEKGEVSGGQLDEVLVPYPADQVVRIILILREPELALFADDIEDLSEQISAALSRPLMGTSNLLLRQRKSDRDSQPLSVHDQY